VTVVREWEAHDDGIYCCGGCSIVVAILIRNIGTWCIGSRTTISVASSIKLVSIVPLVGTRISYIQYANRGTCLKGRTEASASVDAR
jgi:hypothetical protein